MFTGLRTLFTTAPISWNEAGVVPPDAQFSIDSLKAFLLERLSTLSVNQWLKGISSYEMGSQVRRCSRISRSAAIVFSGQYNLDVGDNITDVKPFSCQRPRRFVRSAITAADRLL